MNLLNKERLGKFTASRISDLLPVPALTDKQLALIVTLQSKAKLTDKQQIELNSLLDKQANPPPSKTRDKYIFEKAKESVQGYAKAFGNKNTQHGNFNEFEAITEFRNLTGIDLEYLDQAYFPVNENSGATPDAAERNFDESFLASGDVKCPTDTFFEQKMMFIQESKPEFQNSPKNYFFQGQWQMLSLSKWNAERGFPPVKKHYLIRYLTNWDIDDDGNKTEIDLPLEARMFYKTITFDKDVCDMLLKEVDIAAQERDMLIKIFKTPII
jgi:hypothetical protein